MLLSGWLLWPVPSGAMPMSADHTVHLTRIWMWATELAQGNLRGWSTVWFFGTPVGELYPVLGDAVIVGLRVVSFGALSWAAAYAVGFFVVFTVQGLAMIRVGRATGLGPWVGVVAAGLLLCDVGAYREGGWLYTVAYGVWPQALSTALTWLAFGELAVAATTDETHTIPRRIGLAALAIGGSLLAHPMAMLSTAIGGPLLVITLGFTGKAALRRTVSTAVIAVGLGLAIAAWWLVPMLDHRGWMAAYGWMWQPLSKMGEQAAKGQFTQAMPAAVGVVIMAGIVLVAVTGSRPARLLVAFGLVLWMVASRDVLWELRLDQLSRGFAHIQYQRFIIAAKPGLFLAAGVCVGLLGRWGAQLWRVRRGRPMPAVAAAGMFAMAAVAVLAMADGMRETMAKYAVGRVQTERLPGDPQREADFAALTQWAAEQRAQSEAPWRMTFDARRNVHWFMDAPVYSGVASYKQGFTPGDNFVHKPESGRARILDRLGVRYVVSESKRRTRRAPVAEFGALRVTERANWAEQPIAWLDGEGSLRLDATDPARGSVTGEITGSGGTTRLIFAIGAFPRWTLTHNGEPVEWIEVPVTGKREAATQAQRRNGDLRGGKAGGDDGSEPTLLAADLPDGTFELHYRAWTLKDVLALVLSALALGLSLALVMPQGRAMWARRWLSAAQRVAAPIGHPVSIALVAALTLAWAVTRWHAAGTAEDTRAVGWVADGRARVSGRASTQPFKTDMLIQPAVVLRGRRKGPTTIVFPSVALADVLSGWVAIDDDASKMRRDGTHTMTIEVGTQDNWTSLRNWKVPHREGTAALALPLGAHAGTRADIRVTVASTGKRPPPLAFDLELGAG